MPPKLTRDVLLDEIQREYDKLLTLIDRVPKKDMATSSINSAGWSLKDALAHVADWAHRCADWCKAGLADDAPEPPSDGFKWNETRKLNEAIYNKRKKHSLPRVLRDFHAGHEALVELAQTMDERDLCDPKRFAWCGPSWSVAKHIRANTASHYRWASKHFRTWLASQKS
ncbi:MAG: ClbS/DfsB family four-helix bundle protein [Phycisphaeraceae bacterium]|nr:ClbS/DfsB family four-helix bundle protein [Phycisphaerales bacterium]MCB9859898.1 ClbS/DfsB family four-helix bundle protein [Phycisphaeraceae bacterium]